MEKDKCINEIDLKINKINKKYKKVKIIIDRIYFQVYNLPIINLLEVIKMDNRFKKLITVIVLIFLAIIAIRIALKIVGVILGILLPLAVIGVIGYVVFRLITNNSTTKY